jgi:hypothetical protein
MVMAHLLILVRLKPRINPGGNLAAVGTRVGRVGAVPKPATAAREEEAVAENGRDVTLGNATSASAAAMGAVHGNPTALAAKVAAVMRLRVVAVLDLYTRHSHCLRLRNKFLEIYRIPRVLLILRPWIRLRRKFLPVAANRSCSMIFTR